MTAAEIVALPEGAVLALAEHVENPQVDKRVRNDWRLLPAVLAGSRFIVMHDDESGSVRLEPLWTWSHKCVWLAKDGSVPARGIYHDLTAALLPHLAPSPVTLKALFRRHHAERDAGCVRVVKELIAQGRLTLAEVEALYLASLERTDEP